MTHTLMTKTASTLPVTTPLVEEVSNTYLSPTFNDADRLLKLKAVFPEIDAIYQQYAKENHFPGYAYGIILDGKLVHIGCEGVMDREKRDPVTAHSMFRIASMTKSFVAMAILKLRDEGRLRLDDPVSVYISEIQENLLTEDAPNITIRDLLLHSSGLPFDDPWADRQLDITHAEFEAFLENGLSFSTPTGTSYEYSSLGYALLGEIIRKVSGISYEQYIADNIWQPIGMREASWNFTDIPASQLVHGYRWIREDWKEEPLLSDGAFGAIGGVITSIESFSRYVALHQFAWPPRDEMEAVPIRRSSIREMHQPWRFIDLVPNFKNLEDRTCIHTYAYGYGLFWARDSHGRVFVGHSGGLPGFGSNWFMMPEYGLGVVSFANVTYAPMTKINLGVLDKLVVAAQLNPRKLPPSKILQERQKALLQLLPDWEDALASSFLAKNFFLDHSLDFLKKETIEIFAKAGKIISVGDVVPESQLKGHFVLKGEVMNLRINFSLTPEVPPLIQEFQIGAEEL